MGYILEFNKWKSLNEAESYFNKEKGGQFAHLKDKGLVIMNKLIAKYNYSPILAAALVGNMFKESKFDPTIVSAYNPDTKTNYYGLVQWSKTRFGNTAKTLDAQLELINKELTGKYLNAKKSIESAPSVEKATELAALKYEGCADPTNPKRINGAKEIYDLYQESKLPEVLAFKAPEVSPDDDSLIPPIED
jgi:hypothetical protein